MVPPKRFLFAEENTPGPEQHSMVTGRRSQRKRHATIRDVLIFPK
jgi:hypothetical protein